MDGPGYWCSLERGMGIRGIGGGKDLGGVYYVDEMMYLFLRCRSCQTVP